MEVKPEETSSTETPPVDATQEKPENPLVAGLKQVEDDRKAQIAARKQSSEPSK